jgi:hypothetical protein
MKEYDAYLKASSLDNPGRFLKAVLARSPFGSPAARNLARMVSHKGLAGDVLEYIRQAVGHAQTKVVEDGNHFLRNLEQRNQTHSSVSGTRMWHTLAAKNISGEVPLQL